MRQILLALVAIAFSLLTPAVVFAPPIQRPVSGPIITTVTSPAPAQPPTTTQPAVTPFGFNIWSDSGTATTTTTTARASGNGSSVARTIPAAGYYPNLAALCDGNYQTALKSLKAQAAIALETVSSRWIDSICYRTMIGECYYRLGQPATALENYDAAAKLSLEVPNWMLGFRFSATPPPPVARGETPWGRSNRATNVERLPQSLPLPADQNLYDPAGYVGGAYTATNTTVTETLAKLTPPTYSNTSTVTYGPPSNYAPPTTKTGLPGALYPQGWLFLTDVPEVVRCAALALKRRHELMGPVCSHDPLSASIAALLARRLARRDPFSQAWIDAELGMAYLGTDKHNEAVECLKRAVSLPGNVDHRLTPLVLLELGQLALESGDSIAAENLLAEASYSGYDYGDLGVIEEAFRGWYQAFAMGHSSQQGPFPPLAAAVAWSANHGREVHAALLTLQAEDEARLHHVAQAALALTQARVTIGARDAAAGELGARLNFVSASVDFLQNHTPLGERSLSAALDYEKNGSIRLFQIHLLDHSLQGHVNSSLTRQWALPLYGVLLRDPTATDWFADPLESTAVLSSPLDESYDEWFEAALRTGPGPALEVADRARRHRFLSSLPIGGRLMSLRWLLEAPTNALTREMLLERQELQNAYPQYAAVSKKARALQVELSAVPVAAADAAGQRKLTEELAELARLSTTEESLIRDIALCRNGADFAFPPLRTMKEVQAALPQRQYLLAFFQTHDELYAWLLSNSRCAMWKVQSPRLLKEKIVALLKAIGNFDANHELHRAQLAQDDWQRPSHEVLQSLVAGSKVNLGGMIDELIVVPDGVLWYLPFEALEVDAAAPGVNSAPLLAKTKIRYLPTVGLAVPDARDRDLGQTGVIVGKADPHDGPELAAAELQALSKAVPQAAALKRPLPTASPIYASLFDSLMVLDEIPVAEKSTGADWPYSAWSPIQGDRFRNSATLAAWFTMPWKKPSVLVLPGFHTPAENSLRQLSAGRPGDDLFLSLCGLMSTGERTVLISRWRIGGATSAELTQRFVQDLPYTTASDSWQRAVQMLWQTPLDVDHEPRVARSTDVIEATGQHPLFWAGYLLCDTGSNPPKAEKLAAGK